MKKWLTILFMFVLSVSMSYATIEEQRGIDDILEFHQKLEPIKLYVEKDKPCVLKFGYPIRSYYFTDPKKFEIKAGIMVVFELDEIRITATDSNIKTFLFVELETIKYKKRACHFIEIIEDEKKAENRYFISPRTEFAGIEGGIRLYEDIDVKN